MSDSSRMQRDPATTAAPNTLPYGTGVYPRDQSAAPGDSKALQPGPGGVINPPRVEANTQLIKLSQQAQEEQPPQEQLATQNSEEMPSELASSGLMGLGSNSGTAILDTEDDGNTEAASARIAQEY